MWLVGKPVGDGQADVGLVGQWIGDGEAGMWLLVNR